ncbi:hypothetical protein FDECE_62 [Fusarium decemcellulare]|nr:hypothetical protein FDECE_62 [Fusarium decemcellulare]
MRVLFLVVLLTHLTIAQNTLPQICSGVKNLSGCKATFPIPSGLKLNTKTTTKNVYNKCKSKVQKTVKCPTKKDPKRTCKQWKCVPGWEKKTTTVPVGLYVLTKQVDLCLTVRNVLGNTLGLKFIKSSDAICNCFPQVQKMSNGGQFNSISTKGELTSANTNIITEASRLQTCLVNGGISVKDGKATIANELKSGNGWTVAPAAEIDLATYKNMIAAANACQSGTCNQNVIRNTFAPYLTQTNKLMVKPLGDILGGWSRTLTEIHKNTRELDSLAGDLLGALEAAQPIFETAKQVICEELNRCSGPGFTDYMAVASELLARIDHLWQIRGPLDVPNSQLYDMIEHTSDAVKMLLNLPDMSTLASTIQQGKFKKVSDIFQIIPIAKALPKLAAEIKTGLEPVKQAIEDYGSDTTAADDQLRQLLMWTRWEDRYPDEFHTEDTEADEKLMQEFTKIQDAMGAIFDPMVSYGNDMHFVRLELKWFSVTNGTFAVENKIASYQRWSTLDMNMPCSKTESKTFEKSGFKRAYSWKKYFKCKLGPLSAYFPKHYNPYIRIRGGSGIGAEDL